MVADGKAFPMATKTQDLVLKYLQEAEATEQSLVTNLRAHIALTPRGSYRSSLERHLTETQQHARAIATRIRELGGGSRGLLSTTYGVVSTLVGQTLVLSKGPLDALRGAGGEEKLLKNARDEAATEALEIAIYDALEALADKAGDERTAKLAARHREQEERMLAELRRHIPRLADAYAEARAGGRPSYDWETTGAAEAMRRSIGAEPPIPNYDKLKASEIVSRLPDLSQAELQRLIAYEKANANRSTVLQRAESLPEPEPFPGYDDLTAREIARRLSDADERTAARVREYESRHKRRVEVMEAAQRQRSTS
jgi:ferritin-like metal-binding protein YciE